MPSKEEIEARFGARMKKIKREGPTRPWQENLPQYQKANVPIPVDLPITAPCDEPILKTTIVAELSSLLNSELDLSTNAFHDHHELKPELASDSQAIDMHLESASQAIAKQLKSNQQAVSTQLTSNSNASVKQLGSNSKAPTKHIRSSSKALPKQLPSDSQALGKRSASKSTVGALNTKQTSSDSQAIPLINPLQNPKRLPSASQANMRIPLTSLLQGIQLSILLYLFDQCQKVGARQTPPVTALELSLAAQTTLNTVQDAAYRLTKRNMLERLQWKTGRGGWTIYEIPESTFADIIAEIDRVGGRENLKQFSSNCQAKPPAKPPAEVSSKLVSDLNTNLLTVEHGAATDDFASFSADWGGLESHIMKLERFGISAIQLGHLRQQKVKLYGYEIMELTDRFEALAADPKKSAGISSKAGFFVSECRKKAADPKRACFLDAIELPHERELRLQAQVLVQERQRLESAMAAISEQEDSEGFHVWCEKVGGWDAAFNLVPHGLSQKGSSVHRALVREYFRRLDQRVDASIEN